MKLALLGVGQAGGKIVDRFLARDASAEGGGIIEDVLVINTAKTDLNGLRNVPDDRRLLIGETEVGGHGVGGDNELAAKIAEGELEEIQSALTPFAVHRIEAFLVVGALGGGTGSGVAPVLARHLQELYAEPVYGLGILPGSDEGGIYSLNAARSLQTLVDHVDNLLLFDNEAWRTTGESVDASFYDMNAELLKQLDPLFRAGEIEEGEQIAESVVDTSEIINTLSGGGVSTIGYAEDTSVETVESGSKGLLARFKSNDEPEIDSATATNRITSLIRQATRGRLTVPAEVASTERGLVVVAGPPSHLNRKGIEQGRRWLEAESGSMHIRGGDYPWSRDVVAVTVLLGGVTDVPRLDQLKAQAVEARRNLEDIRERHDESIDSLSTEELDSLL